LTKRLSSPAERKSRIDLVFNRPGVFSAQECDALVRWAEAEQGSPLERIDYQLATLEGQALTRRNRQFVAPAATRDPTVAGFRRKLRRWVAALNDRIWQFHVTRFSYLLVVRYDSGDEVGLYALGEDRSQVM
jgi:hypothetical protein